jgi:hypothetical protein
VAAAQAARSGWCKLVGDWGPKDPPISLGTTAHPDTKESLVEMPGWRSEEPAPLLQSCGETGPLPPHCRRRDYGLTTGQNATRVRKSFSRMRHTYHSWPPLMKSGVTPTPAA